MADVFELAYVYARVCGALSRAFVGERAAQAARSGKLADLWRSVFGNSAPALPEGALLKEAERKAVAGAFREFQVMASALESREPFFEALRRKTEFSRVKRILACARDGSTELPPVFDTDLKPEIDDSGYPDPLAMFGQGRYSWIDGEAFTDLPAAENRLDRQFYGELWESLGTVPARRRGALADLVKLEIELENVVWALRLRRYYGMDVEQVEPLLAKVRGPDVVKPALQTLSYRMDARGDWSGWRWERLLRDSGPVDTGWKLDVRKVETAARRYLYRAVRHALHFNPFTYTPLYCFFKIKEFETAVILGLFEGIHLGAPFEEIAAYAFAVVGDER
ncbi:MAG: V-type ATPase subunit [Spirochaetes bacterium]|nr:V-type ATPase subunit [Spirochaetota bacterium]